MFTVPDGRAYPVSKLHGLSRERTLETLPSSNNMREPGVRLRIQVSIDMSLATGYEICAKPGIDVLTVQLAVIICKMQLFPIGPAAAGTEYRLKDEIPSDSPSRRPALQIALRQNDRMTCSSAENFRPVSQARPSFRFHVGAP